MSKSTVIDLNLLVEIGLYKAFVEPFVNVGKVASLTAQKMANPLATMVTLLNPFTDYERKKELMRGFEKRRDEMADDWKQLNREINDSLGPDARLVMFFANPAGYLASTVSKSALGTAKAVALDATGLGRYISEKVGMPWEALETALERSNNAFADSGREPGTILGIERQLNKLFFKESSNRSGKILREQEELPAQISTKELASRFGFELDVLGAAPKLNTLFEEWYQETESLISNLEELIGQKQKLAEQLSQINSIESFIAFVQQAVSVKLIKSEAAKKIISTIRNQANELASDQEFIAQAQAAGKDPQKIADETVLAATLEEIKPQIEAIVKDVDDIATNIPNSIPTTQQLNSLPANENTALLKNLQARLRKISSAIK